MTFVRRSLAVAAVAVSAALVAPAAQAAPAPVIMPPPPPGTCWDPSYYDASHGIYMGKSVPCTSAHTVETAANLDVPPEIAKGGNASPELIAWLDPQCQTEVNRYAGVAKPETAAPGTRTWYFWYTPKQRDWKAGNHWVSCAAGSVPVSMNGTPTLVPVSNSIAGQPSLNKPRTFKSDYGVGTYVARKPLTDWASRSYPGTSGLQSEARAFCKKAIGSNKYFWYGPSEKEWYEGWTAIRCYRITKKK